MLYTLEMGKVEQAIIRQALQNGNPIPDRILNAPQLTLGLQLFFSAFFVLDSSRQVGLGIGAIPQIAMLDYAQRIGLDDEQTEDLIYFIQHMDNAYISWHNEKNKTK